MKKVLLLIILFFASCQKEEILEFQPCLLGECSVTAYPDPVSQPNAYLDENNFWHLNHEGASYFSLILRYSPTKETNAGNTPIIQTRYTTDTWLVTKNGFRLWSARYNPLGSDYTQNFRTAIADTSVVVTIPPSEIKEMVNMSGQYYRECDSYGCGLGPEPIIRTGIAYRSKAKFIYFPEQAQVHDTVRITLDTSYGQRDGLEEVEVINEIKVIL